MATATEAPATAEGLISHTQSQLDLLARLREPFTADQVATRPVVTCTPCLEAPYKLCAEHAREWCDTCQDDLTSAHIHLDFVGHAELTARLLDVDPLWNWEPMAFDAEGLPKFDKSDGLWIRLTVAGVTRSGYGKSPHRRGTHVVKEAIGDALRNAAMRFGMALDLWAKGDQNRAAAEKSALSVEQPRGERLGALYGLMQERWGSVGGLRHLKERVDSEEFAASQVRDADNNPALFGQVLADRIATLENPTPPQPATHAPTADAPAERDNRQTARAA